MTILTRRSMIHSSLTGGVGISLSSLLPHSLPAATDNSNQSAKIKSCIIIFYYGGPSHLDTFDPKPDAPKEVRGEFGTISTSVPGLRIGEHLPHTARVMHKLAVVRSMHHTNRLHDSASTEVLTGRQSPQGDREEFGPIPQFFPCYGATLNYLRQNQNLDVPHAALPWIFRNVINVPCQGGGFLGKAYDPFQIDGDPNTRKYRAEIFKTLDGMTVDRQGQRRRLLETLDTTSSFPTTEENVRQLNQLYEKAYNLLGSKRIAEALDIDQESEQTRKRYGLMQPPKNASGSRSATASGWNLRGQNFLMARRLVEADVPVINVYDFKQQGANWDSHANNFKEHSQSLLPPVDRGFSALIEDLDERGLLDSTLVIATGEFGRTPRINGNAGRDHWPDCFSFVMAGGGIRGGTVYGSSDKTGAYPDENPVSPADLAATFYWRFGLNPKTEIHDKIGRPWKIADGVPLYDLFG